MSLSSTGGEGLCIIHVVGEGGGGTHLHHNIVPLSILDGSVSPSTLGEGGGAHIIIHSVSSPALVEVRVCIIPSVSSSSSNLSSAS